MIVSEQYTPHLFPSYFCLYLNTLLQSQHKHLKCVACVFSVLETERSLVLAEKGSGDNDDVELIKAAASFRLVATMNPGGDFGKKEVDVQM